MLSDYEVFNHREHLRDRARSCTCSNDCPPLGLVLILQPPPRHMSTLLQQGMLVTTAVHSCKGPSAIRQSETCREGPSAPSCLQVVQVEPGAPGALLKPAQHICRELRGMHAHPVTLTRYSCRQRCTAHNIATACLVTGRMYPFQALTPAWQRAGQTRGALRCSRWTAGLPRAQTLGVLPAPGSPPPASACLRQANSTVHVMACTPFTTTTRPYREHAPLIPAYSPQQCECTVERDHIAAAAMQSTTERTPVAHP